MDRSNIFIDWYFTLVTIAQWALEKKIAIAGAMRLVRKGIPKDINREERSVLYVFETDENILLVSYIDKNKSGKRTVVVISTLHDEVRVTKDPSIHKSYDHTKCSVDVVSLISTSCTKRIKNKR